MPEYFGPNSLQALSELVNADLKNTSGDGSAIEGPQGPPGETPFIGENGNWWIGDTDTGVSATGGGSGIAYNFDKDYFEVDGNAVSLKTTDTYAEGSNKMLPMTAAGVEAVVGNIDILLQTI